MNLIQVRILLLDNWIPKSVLNKTLKELINDVHWFHRKKGFDGPFTNNVSDEFEELTSTFEEMEAEKNNLSSIISRERTTLEKRQKVVYNGEVILVIAFIVSIL